MRVPAVSTACFVCISHAGSLEQIRPAKASTDHVAELEHLGTFNPLAMLLLFRDLAAGFQVLGAHGQLAARRMSSRGSVNMEMDCGSTVGKSHVQIPGRSCSLRENLVLSRRTSLAIGPGLAAGLAFLGSTFLNPAAAGAEGMFPDAAQYKMPLADQFRSVCTDSFDRGFEHCSADTNMYALPVLPYNHASLEPYHDEEGVDYHKNKWHKRYVRMLNTQMKGKPRKTLLQLMPEAKAAGMSDAVGGHYNHCMYFDTMSPRGGGKPSGKLLTAIESSFGSFTNFQSKWSESAASVFGSGWTWLVVDKDAALKIVNTPLEDNPLMDDNGLIPILGVDLWEHAFFWTKRQNRGEYVTRHGKVINWRRVEQFYAKAAEGKAIPFGG